MDNSSKDFNNEIAEMQKANADGFKKLENKLKELIAASKETLNFDEAANYLDLSKSYLYLLTSEKRIPHYKPNGKRIYFDRNELDQWIRQNRIKPAEETEIEAASYTMR